MNMGSRRRSRYSRATEPKREDRRGLGSHRECVLASRKESDCGTLRPVPPRQITPRKRPSTSASTVIAESIVSAAQSLLEADGMDRFTTNRVAERAGVSIGSLYQYFPNKEALLAELVRRLERRTEALLLRILEDSSAQPLLEVVARIVDALLDELGDLKVRQVLRREVPMRWAMPVSQEVDYSVRMKIAMQLARRLDVRPGPHPVMALVIGHAIEHVIETVVLGAPALARSPELRVELVELAVRYLRRDPAC